MKYIIVKHGPIIFNEHTTHKDVGEAYQRLEKETGEKWIYSAGFWDFKGGKVVCWGKSESLEIESIPEKDSKIITDMFNPVSQVKYGFLNVANFYEEKTKIISK